MLSQWLSKLASFLRMQEMSGLSARDRGRERLRRAFLSSLAAIAAKAVGVSAQFITIPLTLNYLGVERFGLWMTMSSMIAMLAFADLGIGNGLLNAVSNANGKDDSAAIRRLISSAIVILSLVSAIVLCVFGLAYSHISWESFFNVHTDTAIAEAGPSAAVFVICFALNILATIVQRVQLGLQIGLVTNLWQAIGSIMTLVAVLLVVHFQLGLQWLVLAFAGTPIITSIVNALLFFGRFRKDLAPRVSLATRKDATKIINTGLPFLVLQIVVSVTYLSDNAVIARVLGASAVTAYALPEKLFSIIPMILSFMLTPLWPAYGEALARGDYSWMKEIFKKTLFISLAVSTTISLIFLMFGGKILSLWTGQQMDPPLVLMLGIGLWKIIESLGISVAAYLNGCNLIREQVVMAVLTGTVAICTKFYLAERYGIAGPIYATILAYLIFTALPVYFLVKKTWGMSRT